MPHPHSVYYWLPGLTVPCCAHQPQCLPAPTSPGRFSVKSLNANMSIPPPHVLCQRIIIRIYREASPHFHLVKGPCLPVVSKIKNITVRTRPAKHVDKRCAVFSNLQTVLLDLFDFVIPITCSTIYESRRRVTESRKNPFRVYTASPPRKKKELKPYRQIAYGN